MYYVEVLRKSGVWRPVKRCASAATARRRMATFLARAPIGRNPRMRVSATARGDGLTVWVHADRTASAARRRAIARRNVGGI